MCREEVEVLQQVRNMATTRPAQRLRDPILLPMPICLLYNDKSWRLSRRIQATMECTYKQFHEQRAVMPVSCELLDLLKMSKLTVRDAIEHLMQEGMLYSTIDDLVSVCYVETQMKLMFSTSRLCRAEELSPASVSQCVR